MTNTSTGCEPSRYFGSDGDDVFVDAIKEIEIKRPTSNEGANQSNTFSKILPSPDTSPEFGHVLRFKTRTFSFPNSPPKTPTKRSQGNQQANLELKSPEISAENSVLEFRYLGPKDVATSTSVSSTGAVPNSLGISYLSIEQRSTIFAPATPQLQQGFRYGSFQPKSPLTPPETPSKNRKALYSGNEKTLGKNTVAGHVDKLSEHVEKTTPHFSNTRPQSPLSPPTTPNLVDDPQFGALESKKLPTAIEHISDAAKDQDDTTTAYLLSVVRITSIFNALHAPQPSCSGCTSFSINVDLFSAISAALSFHLPTIHGSLQTHPALISHIMALVPNTTKTIDSDISTQTRLFAALKTQQKPTYREIDFHALLKYQAFRRREFQIECSSTCGKHDRGYIIWKFSYREVVCEGAAGSDRAGVSNVRELAAYKRGVLERKIAYHSR